MLGLWVGSDVFLVLWWRRVLSILGSRDAAGVWWGYALGGCICWG